MAHLRLLTYRGLSRLHQLLIGVTHMSLCRPMSMLILPSFYMNISEQSRKLNLRLRYLIQVECK